MLKEKGGSDYSVEFTVTFGWFKRFKNCYSLYNVKVNGESLSVSVKVAEEFWKLVKLIMKKITCQTKYSMWMKLPYARHG